MKGYKGFGKGLKCRGFQFEIGKTYTHSGDIKLCEKGFHFCENPLDVLTYYPLNTSDFAEVEATGKTLTEKDKDSKVCTDEITIKAKVDLKSFIGLSVKAIFDFCKKKTTGDYAHSATTGVNTIACALGFESKAKSTAGNWIVLSEWVIKNDKRVLKSVKSAKVDGKRIKANVFYMIKNGKIMEAK